jgi:lysophospholipase L1-like esterase
MQTTGKRFPTILLLFCSLTVALLIGEAVVQCLLPGLAGRGYYVWPPHFSVVFRPEKGILPGVDGESRFIVNSQGFRGDELTVEHTVRILALGGSATECLYLDQSKAWPRRLQDLLNSHSGHQYVWVGNAGMSGRTSRNHLLAMRYLPLNELRIDMVVLLAGVNDLQSRLSQGDSYPSVATGPQESDEELMAKTFTGMSAPSPEAPFFKKMATWQLLKAAWTRVSSDAPQDEAAKIYVTWRKHRQNASEMRETLPDLSLALDNYERRINRIIDVAREKSIRLLLVTQPAMWRHDLTKEQENLLWLGGEGNFQTRSGMPYYSATALEKGLRAYNDVLLRVCRERAVECMDLSSMLQKETGIFYDDVHFNDSGSRRVAEALSRHILEKGFSRSLTRVSMASPTPR